jgi:NTP pyrophosphatase (non-canonical NTP hydrolase)
MGKFRDEGDPAITLMEELAEAIQVIAKKNRFNGDWNEIPPGKDKTRWEELKFELEDVLYQWERLQNQINTNQ